MIDKVAETLAALARGEKPPCPHCGAAFQGTQVYLAEIVSPEIRTQVARHSWYCGTYTEGTSWDRSSPCWQHTVNALREDYKTKCGELAHAHAEYQRIEGELREKLSSSNECLDMVRETLAGIDGADSPDTPPMMYPEWIQGVVRRQTEKLREENKRLLSMLHEDEEGIDHY